MKKCRQFLSAVLVVSIVLVTVINVAAIDTTRRASDYLSRYLAYVYPDGNGTVSVWFEVQGVQTMDEVGVLTIRLQEKAPTASNWSPAKTFTHTEYTDMLEENNSFHWGHVSYAGTAGYSYRAYVTVWAGKNGNGDSRIILTDAVVAK